MFKGILKSSSVNFFIFIRCIHAMPLTRGFKEKTMAELTITKANFQSEVLDSDKPVLVDFWASWCGPCKMLGPVISEIAEERSDIKVGKVNVDEEEELATQFGVMSIPFVALFKNGQIVKSSVGFKPKEEILSLLD